MLVDVIFVLRMILFLDSIMQTMIEASIDIWYHQHMLSLTRVTSDACFGQYAIPLYSTEVNKCDQAGFIEYREKWLNESFIDTMISSSSSEHVTALDRQENQVAWTEFDFHMALDWTMWSGIF